jgi:hypothetical protein
MIVFSNHRLGAAVELLVSAEVAEQMLQATAEAARPAATARWEHELVRWLEDRAQAHDAVDVGDIAWTPDHFDGQREFLVEAIVRAIDRCEHGRALVLWSRMIQAHPREFVQFGRRWTWHATI